MLFALTISRSIEFLFPLLRLTIMVSDRTFPKGQEPVDLSRQAQKLHGLYGYNHGKHDVLWFLPPGSSVPTSFTPQGTWTLPLEKRNISSIKPEQSGFLKMGDRHQGHERLDVSGQWRMLYKRDGEPIKIYVKTPKGKLIDLVVDPDDTVDDIKTMVYQKEGFPKKEIRLNFKKKSLRDPKATVDDCGIKDRDVLDMEPMQVRVKDVDGKIHTFVVDPSDTVGDLKKQIERDEGTQVPEQRLFFGSDELKQNTPTLRKVGIKHRDLLQLKPMKVNVKTLDDDRLLTFNVKPTDIILSIKTKVESTEKIHVDDQRLVFKGRELNVPGSTLDDNGIKHNDTLNLEPMVIYVATPDRKTTLTLNVRPSDTIEDVKKQVKKKEGIPLKHQRLELNGRQLDDPQATLRINGIRHGDTLNLSPMRIHVRLPDSKRITLMGINPGDTIDRLKSMVDDREAIPPSDQRLFFADRLLNNGKSTLDECGIQHEDTLQLKKWPPPTSPKPVTIPKAAPVPVTPQRKGPEYTIGLSPWMDPFSSPTGYTPKKKKTREGTRSTGAGRLKNRYHTTFDGELHEMALYAKERHRLKKLDEQSIAGNTAESSMSGSDSTGARNKQ